MSQPNDPRLNALASAPVNKLIWKFAIPGIISSVVNSFHNIVDQVFVGWAVGDFGIAATNIAFPLATIITAVSALFGMGGAAKFNLAMGEKDTETAKKTMGNSLMLVTAAGLLMAILGLIFLEPMLYLFGATDAILPYAKPYAAVIVSGLPFGMFATTASYFIRSDGNPNFASITLLSGAVFNMIFDPILLILLNKSIAAVALATVLGQVLSFSLALYYFIRKFNAFKIEKRIFAPAGSAIKNICALGSAIFCNHILMTTANIIQMNSLKFYGASSIYGSEVTIAAAGASGKVVIVLMSCVIGIALGCQPILGFNYGSKNYARVKQTYFLAIRYATTIAVIAFLLIQLFPRTIMSIFGSEDPLFYEFTIRYIRIYLFMTFINALLPVTSTFFTSIGKAKLSLWMSLLRQGLFLIPLTLILPLVLELDGVLWAGFVSDALAAMVVIIFARRELKKMPSGV
ncbi:MAG: MATE family efflux transporter [Firmicutes bacterium]|nr:MATE family efflux transporter [Bacillota bacterium]